MNISKAFVKKIITKLSIATLLVFLVFAGAKAQEPVCAPERSIGVVMDMAYTTIKGNGLTPRIEATILNDTYANSEVQIKRENLAKDFLRASIAPEEYVEATASVYIIGVKERSDGFFVMAFDKNECYIAGKDMHVLELLNIYNSIVEPKVPKDGS